MPILRTLALVAVVLMLAGCAALQQNGTAQSDNTENPLKGSGGGGGY